MKNRKYIKFVIIAAVICLVCLKFNTDRKPHFKVIRGSLTEAAEQIDTKININTASTAELETLEGIGPAIAQRIVDYRAKMPFSAPEELMKVKGIGKSKYDAVKDSIKVQN